MPHKPVLVIALAALMCSCQSAPLGNTRVEVPVVHDWLWDRQGLDHIFYQSDGGHVWSNWRLYLNTFAPMLFK